MSYGRMPDGGDVLRKMEPTKNSSNGGEVHPEVAVVINEILTNGSQDEDWVEFYNGGSADADLEGYVLYDDGGVEKAFTFPAGTVVPAGGYLVMVAKEEGSFDFGLGKKGDALTLLDASGAVTDEVEIPALDDDETYGRRTDARRSGRCSAPPPAGLPMRAARSGSDRKKRRRTCLQPGGAVRSDCRRSYIGTADTGDFSDRQVAGPVPN